MRRRIIEAITYPRMVLQDSLDAEECPLNFYFNATHRACRYCERAEECRWLNGNDEFSILAKKPMDELFDSLIFCIEVLDAQCTLENHNVSHCTCDSCGWVRRARRLAWECRDLNDSLS